MAPSRRTQSGGAAQRVAISYAGYNRAWAAWLGDRLERHGCQVSQLRWDPPVDAPLEEALRDLLLADGRVLVVLSDWYFQLGPRSTEEWNAALRAVVAPNAERFAAVSVTTQPMPTATAAFGGVAELWGVGAREAERRLLRRLSVSPSRATPPGGTALAPPGGSDGLSGSTQNLRLGDARAPRFPYEQPRVWGGVPRRNIRFTGREATLHHMYEVLQGAEPGAGVVTLLGMSGVGKTQIAAEYVYRFGSEYDMAWWVPADQRGTLRQRLAELAPALHLTTGPEYGERLRAVRDALRRGDPYPRWLLVLDGADDPEAIADLLPTGTGHTLITSQNRGWDQYNTELLEVPVYAREESVAFIRRRAPRIEAPDANQLAEALGDLPLALDQTAGWLGDATMTVPEYVELLRSGADLEMGLRIAADFPMSYYTAFSILLNRLRETVPEAVDLLRLCSFFAAGNVPTHLLRSVPAGELPERLAGLMDDPLRWNAALGKLVQYSVVRWDTSEEGAEEDPADTIHLHRMVHQTVRADMSEAEQRAYASAVRGALAAADPHRPTDTRRWPRFAELVPHLEPSGALASRRGSLHQLIFNCLRYLYLAGEYQAGIQLAERTQASWRELFGADHPLLWDLASQQATLVRATGDYARTERLDRAVINHLSAERGPGDLSVLRAQEGLGADLRGLARYQESLEVSQQVLDGYRAVLSGPDARVYNAQHNLAISLRLLGRYAEALEIDRANLEARRELLRPRHNYSLSSEHAYALDLRLLGRYDEARSVIEQSVELHRVVMGRDNPQTLTAELNLALSLHRCGDRAEAVVLLSRLLERAERVLGDGSPLTLRIAAAYSFVQRASGDLDRAREVGEPTMERYRETLGARHPYTVGTTANHALVLRAAGERQQSQVLLEECLSDMSAALGPDHPWTLGVALNVAAGRSLEGDTEGAAALSRETEHRAAATLGPRHPLRLSALVSLATDLRGLRQRVEEGEADEARQLEEEALAGLANTLGAQHPHTVSSRSRVRPYWDFEPLHT